MGAAVACAGLRARATVGRASGSPGASGGDGGRRDSGDALNGESDVGVATLGTAAGGASEEATSVTRARSGAGRSSSPPSVPTLCPARSVGSANGDGEGMRGDERSGAKDGPPPCWGRGSCAREGAASGGPTAECGTSNGNAARGRAIGATPRVRAVSRARKSVMSRDHAEIGRASPTIHRQDVGLTPSVGARECIDFGEEPAGERLDLGPEEGRDVEQQRP
jgi:hypothetical protein